MNQNGYANGSIRNANEHTRIKNRRKGKENMSETWNREKELEIICSVGSLGNIRH